MKNALLLLFLILMLGIFSLPFFSQSKTTGAPPYDGSNSDYVTESEEHRLLKNWKRPDSPPRVALQAGHWKNDEVPEELHNLRGNSGATGGGRSEWEVNLAVAEETKKLLEPRGITVEILPATVPEHYWADVFVAIHADGHEDLTKTGFKAAAPRRDYNGGKSQVLLKEVRKTYSEVTELPWDEETITRNMRGYYGFSWWRYDHAVHPMTASIILETGFLTSPGDREIIVDQPELSAEGLANGIIHYLDSQNLL